jgi:hypothetical protein
MPCISCGRSEDLHKVDHIGNLMACGVCLGKHDAVEIAAEADRLLTEWFLAQKQEPVCLVCRGPVLVHTDGTVPMWCQACELKRKAYVNARAA